LFQREDISVSAVIRKIEVARIKLENMKETDGAKLHNFYEELGEGEEFKGTKLRKCPGPDSEVFQRNKEILLDSVLATITERFSNLHGEEVFTSTMIFDTQNWPEGWQDLKDYGNSELKYLINHFQGLLTNITNKESILAEWLELKLFLKTNRHIRRMKHNELWQKITNDDDERKEYQNILTMVHLTLIYPLSTACCERGFSTMKRVKSDWRNKLQVSLNNFIITRIQ
jgi:hypothetical protein